MFFKVLQLATKFFVIIGQFAGLEESGSGTLRFGAFHLLHIAVGGDLSSFTAWTCAGDGRLDPYCLDLLQVTAPSLAVSPADVVDPTIAKEMTARVKKIIFTCFWLEFVSGN